MDFETKLVVILRNDLEAWQKLNVTAFLMSGIGGTQNIIGEPYKDASGVEYLPMSQQPIIVFASNSENMREILKKSLDKEVKTAIYIEELFTTYNDTDNRNKVSQFTTDELNLVGIAMIGKKNHIAKLTKGLEKHN